MIVDRIGTLLARFGNTRAGRAAAVQHAEIWRRAAERHPALVADLIRHGGLLQPQPVIMQGGVPEPAPMDPQRLAYEAGRRDLALQLLSAAGLTHDELTTLTQDQAYD